METELFLMHFKFVFVKAWLISIRFHNAGYLLEAGKPYYALALVGLIIPQVVFQVKNAS